MQTTELPIGVVAIDGKSTVLPSCDDHFAHRQTADAGALRGAMRTMTCCLISSWACPCIDAIPIPAETNEIAIFQRYVCELLQAYEKLDLFRLLATDAGSCSQDATPICKSGVTTHLRLRLGASRSPRWSERAEASAMARRGQKLATPRAVDSPRSIHQHGAGASPPVLGQVNCGQIRRRRPPCGPQDPADSESRSRPLDHGAFLLYPVAAWLAMEPSAMMAP